jgi:hypothetical protein
LERLFSDIEKGRYSEELLAECPELAAAVTDTEKAKYRVEIMKRVSVNFVGLSLLAYLAINKFIYSLNLSIFSVLARRGNWRISQEADQCSGRCPAKAQGFVF